MSTPTGHVSCAEYGRTIGVGKSGISRLIARGMPFVAGTDDHNRFCKFIDPDAADAWRAVNLQPKINGDTGRMRGVVEPRHTAPVHSKPPQPAEAVSPPSDAYDSDGGEPDTPPGVKPAGNAPRPSTAVKAGGRELTPAEEIAAETQSMRLQKIRDETATARLRRLAAEGKLIDREVALEGHAMFVGQVGKLLDRIPADNASTLAAELGTDAHKTYLALQKMADGLRSDLASTSARERDRAGLREVELPEPDVD